MLAALAGVWLLVFVPSWASSTENRDERRKQQSQAKQSRKAELAKLATSPILQAAVEAQIAKSRKRISGFSTVAFLAALGWSIGTLATNSQWLIWAGVSAGGIIVSVVANRLAERSYSAAVAKSSRGTSRMKFGVRPSDLANNVNQDASQESQAGPRAWVATGVPSQLYRSATGTLATPKFAEVVDFADEVEKREDKSAVSNETASINIDEILRRRRANG